VRGDGEVIDGVEFETLPEVGDPEKPKFVLFFDEAQRNCGIYELRPKQCRSFPFWEYFKTHTKELEEECIGVKF